MDKLSLDRLAKCSPNIIKFTLALHKKIPVRVNEGLRAVERQKHLVSIGASRTMNSRHLPNKQGLSEAVDLYPLVNGKVPANFKSKEYEALCYKMVKLAYEVLEENPDLKIRFGADWNMNRRYDDQKFNDIVHFEEMP